MPGVQERSAGPPGQHRQEASHSPHGTAHAKCLCKGVTGLHAAGGFFWHIQQLMLESETPSAGKRACLRKEHKGNFKVCILACTELQWEIKTPLQREQQVWGSASPAAAGELRCCLPHCGKVHELTYCTGSWRDHWIMPDAGFLLGVLIHKGDTLRGAGGTSPM